MLGMVCNLKSLERLDVSYCDRLLEYKREHNCDECGLKENYLKRWSDLPPQRIGKCFVWSVFVCMGRGLIVFFFFSTDFRSRHTKLDRLRYCFIESKMMELKAEQGAI